MKSKNSQEGQPGDRPNQSGTSSYQKSNTQDLFEAILSRLVKSSAHPNAAGWTQACCPLHEDTNRSFSVHPNYGWRCFTTCGRGSLLDLARKLGISTADSDLPGLTLKQYA